MKSTISTGTASLKGQKNLTLGLEKLGELCSTEDSNDLKGFSSFQ